MVLLPDMIYGATIFCLLLLGTGPDLAADGLDLVDQVQIQAPPQALPVSPPQIVDLDQTPDAPSMGVGRVLLHRKGCITCHQMVAPSQAGPRGPRLDLLAYKVSPAWLEAWLQEPTAYLPASTMPHVPLQAETRRRLIAFLLSRASDHLAPPLPQRQAEPYNGADLFHELACEHCHVASGSGGQTGPALDLLGRKVSRHWLYAFLKAPRFIQPGSDSHDFHLVDQDAWDLTAFLARRFAAGGEMPLRFTPLDTDSTAAAQGLSAAIAKGCFQCHAIGPLLGPPLQIPTSPQEAATWANFHRSPHSGLPAIDLTPPQRDALANALQLPPPQPVALSTNFWDFPVPTQGPAPAAFSTDAQTLSPRACGTCHTQQLKEWQSSRHARALSPGLLGQLVDFRQDDPAFVRLCLSCHAPLTEQYQAVEQNPQPGVGITCTACHVRAHQYFTGPAPSQRLPADRFTGGYHAPAQRSPEMAQSDFCSPCHQFAPDGLAFAGKLLQNTHAEWARSPQAHQGQTCQSCHMPAGAHTWLGIHDRTLMSAALELEIAWDWQEAAQRAGHYQITLHNRGAGHHLPTYTTPALFVQVALTDAEGIIIDGTQQTRTIRRYVQLERQREVYDSRIPAGGAWLFSRDQAVPKQARFLNVLVEVDPDYFYRDFFERLSVSEQAYQLIDQAHAEIRDSPYILFNRSLPLYPQ
ncbi:MAG: hypothetical protein GKR89_05375 [Candidatus Latescibacteria bacterium]|nr:hypothetical protein [Candidatus Latescibacterota bacterium]